MGSQAKMGKTQELDENVESLRELGISWQLTDAQIDACIYEALEKSKTLLKTQDVPVNAQAKDASAKSSSCRRCLWMVCYVWGAIAICVVGSYVLLMFHEPSARWVSRVTQPLNYPVFRYIRLLSLPLARKYDLTGMYDSFCLVNNPLLREPSMECDVCEQVKKVEALNKEKMANFKEEYLGQGNPVVIMDGLESAVTLPHLQNSLTGDSNEIIWQQGTRIETTDSTITTPDQFVNNLTVGIIQQNEKFHLEWRSNSVGASRIIRRLFPKPYFVPVQSEVGLEKRVFIDGQKAEPYTLPVGHFHNTLLVQGSGSRRYILIPKQECFEVCQTHDVTLQPKEMLYYNDHVWRVDSIPVMVGHEIPDPSIVLYYTFYG